MSRLPFPTWCDLADTLASRDLDQRVTDDDAGFWIGVHEKIKARGASFS